MTTNFQTIRLSRGSHRSPDEGACVMELSSMIAGEPFSDRPQSVCRVIASFLRAYNDVARDRDRQDLYRCAADVIGTRASGEIEQARLERCEATLGELGALRSRSLVWRLRSPAPCALAGDAGGDQAVEQFMAALARVMRAGSGRGHACALKLIDQLVAVDAGPPEPGSAAAPAAARRSTEGTPS
jgi:hypothetical protein